jgi:hypothetical protein
LVAIEGRHAAAAIHHELQSLRQARVKAEGGVIGASALENVTLTDCPVHKPAVV